MATAMMERKSRQRCWDTLGEGSTSFHCLLAFHCCVCSGAHWVSAAVPFLGHSDFIRRKLTVSSARVNSRQGATLPAGKGLACPPPFHSPSTFAPKQLPDSCLPTSLTTPLTCCNLSIPHRKMLNGKFFAFGENEKNDSIHQTLKAAALEILPRCFMGIQFGSERIDEWVMLQVLCSPKPSPFIRKWKFQAVNTRGDRGQMSWKMQIRMQWGPK